MVQQSILLKLRLRLRMYVLVKLKDKLRILPSEFNRDPAEVLTEQIELKYSNKVILEVGLCVAFYDFVEISEPHIYPSEGSSHQFVTFRLVIYRPFVGEVLSGKISASDENGIRVSMGFFDDIYIHRRHLVQPSSFDTVARNWVWHSEDSGDLPLELNDEIRFRVQDCIFTFITNSKKERRTMTYTSSKNKEVDQAREINRSAGGLALGDQAYDAEKDDPVMQITGSIIDNGLGCTEWWR